MSPYDHKEIEKKWQDYWEKHKLDIADDSSEKPKFYGLIEFPFPSGDGLHVGHIRSDTAMDIIARKRRAEGFNVLYPIGWDAFGLPTENYAIKTGKTPQEVAAKNISTFKRQLKEAGFSFDWSREIDTTDPKYYKWTQWIFLQMLKHDLAYKKKMAVNWCPKDLIGLANEEVVDGKCERCGTPVEKREREQWMLAITKYADRLDSDLDTVNFLEKIKIQQRNWIGKSEGAEIEFLLDFKKNPKDNERRGPNGERAAIKVFTTRPDTLFGATYVVLSPEHLWVTLAADDSHDVLENKAEVRAYIEAAKKKSEMERTADAKDKTGIELKGVKAINPATKEEIPMFIADYVLAGYGTGAVMAVPAHDERDWDFAKQHDLPIREVVLPVRIDKKNPPQEGKKSVERKTIHALVLDPKTGKMLCIKWKKFPWTGFVVGGVDDGEDIVAAARREVLEETGYKNLKFVRILGGQVRGEYFAAHKGENRVAISNGVVFELENDERAPIGQEEMDKHEVVWLDPKTLNHDNFTCAELDLWMSRMPKANEAYGGEGMLANSGDFTGKDSEASMKGIVTLAGGRWVTKFKLRDWVFSRQRYWGEPIPVIHCEKCGTVPVPEKDLPVELPPLQDFKPTEAGDSPLAKVADWVNVKCPACRGDAKRETDVMPNWAGSSWYYLRYVDPKNSKALGDAKKLKHWIPVDWYNGGMEHTTLHLLYSRFWHKFLFDIGVVPTAEPYAKRTSHGLILAEGGVKMSKSKGNVVNPDDIIRLYGADTLRVYEMFMGPFDQPVAWSTESIIGSRRFLERVWRLAEKSDAKAISGKATASLVQKTIKKVSEDIESMRFNTAVSSMMILVNEFEKEAAISQADYQVLLQLLAPFAPHIADELWNSLGNRASIHTSTWPVADLSLMAEEEPVIGVSVNGKVRAEMKVSENTPEESVRREAEALPELKKWLEGKKIIKVIYVKNKLINFVIGQ